MLILVQDQDKTDPEQELQQVDSGWIGLDSD